MPLFFVNSLHLFYCLLCYVTMILRIKLLLSRLLLTNNVNVAYVRILLYMNKLILYYFLYVLIEEHLTVFPCS